MNAPELPPQAVIFQLVAGVWAAQAVATFARLGVADRLTGGARTAAELAPGLGVDAGALYRLLRGVASVEVLAMDDDGRFSLTPVGECLRADVLGSMRSTIIAETAPGHWLPWGHLEDSVRTGKPAAPAVLGMDVWEYYRHHPEEGHHFAQSMSGLSAMAMMAVLVSCSFAGARKVVDVGGSHGGFLSAVLQQNPEATGILFDRAEVVEGAGPTLEAAGVAGRVDRVGGDFFQGVPAGGDTYLLKHILHDWNDDECVQILRNIAASMTPDGRVVVVELLITKPGSGPASPAALLDLNMLVMLPGKERTAEDFAALFASAGLRLQSVTETPSPFAIIEARKA